MKKIEAIIRPERIQLLRDKLSDIGIGGMTITEAAGTGKQKGGTGIFRGTTFKVELLPKIKVEIVADEDQLEKIIDLMIKTCSTGDVGDGKIFISPIEQTIRIRTGERGEQAVL
ncbi:nitrogen regulatory protein P-II family [Lentibacillus halodurans]|uniref:Nitrogen regulatory protein P-II family n=1 Tax=Lentibacillus halodurans TaxID=237679 RepID=A0A1I1A389_9BACI|nr:P-II family nitrogen regulator [Lentibacillus halodurans]SFB31048.1 nitrogen regulatory protein P-II family [Lentibacillus halodurans]